MKTNKGLTLVELLGSMVILGLLMIMVVPNIVGILSKNKEKTYKEDAKKLVEVAKYKISMKKDGVVPPNQNGQCVLFGLGYLDNAEFANPPNDGCYDVTRSYVAVKLENHRYVYYVQLVEYFDGKYTGIIGPVKYEDLQNASIQENKTLNYSYFKYKIEASAPKALVIEDEKEPLSPISVCTNYVVKAHNGPKTYSTDSRGICAQKNV